MLKKIGIFAGTFDPVHNGHIAFATAAVGLGLEKVMFLVEPRPRHKQGVRALEHRIAMVQLATSEQPRMGTIVLEQARFTVDETLPVLQKRFPGYKLVLLFGDDVIKHIAHWPHITDLVESTDLLIASRYSDNTQLKETMKTLEKTRNLKFQYKIIHMDEPAASSVIRLGLKRSETVSGLPEVVQRYIRRHKLYGPADPN